MFDAIVKLITDGIAAAGYAAVVLLMGLESANIPIPSEIILPFAGFLAAQGKMNIHLAALAGALGCLWGSLLSYWLGKKYGRAFLLKHGRWFMIGPKQIAQGDRLFSKYGNATAFISRLFPVVRTFISFIAGIWQVKLKPFVVLTFVGSWIWSYLLVYVGYALGENWETLRPLWHKFDVVIVAAGIAMVIAYVWYHLRSASLAASPEAASVEPPKADE